MVCHRYWPAHGGSERFFQRAAEEAVRRGYGARVWTTDALDVRALWERGRARAPEARAVHRGVEIERFKLRYLPWHGRMQRVLSLLVPGAGKALIAPPAPLAPGLVSRAFTTARQADLILTTALPYDSLFWVSARLARRWGVPWIAVPFVHLGEPDNDRVRRHYSRPHQLALLSRADLVVVQTRLEGEFLAGCGVAQSPPAPVITGGGRRMLKLGMGVDPEELDEADVEAVRRKYGLSRPYIVHVAPLCVDKGSVALLSAWQALRGRGRAVDLVLVGARTAEFEAALRAVECDGLHLLENLSEAEKNGLVAGAEILALPSRTDSYGIVFLEAWYYGRPVVGARAGGIPEVVADGERGLLVPFGDVEALAEALERLLSDGALAERLGQAGRRFVVEEALWSRRMEALFGAVEELLGGRG